MVAILARIAFGSASPALDGRYNEGAIAGPDGSTTYASVTDVSCECGYLQRSADDPDVPIEFDQETNEFRFSYGGAMVIIYHCPFCGGTAPKSKRPLLYAVISSQEQERLAKLLKPVRSIRSALKRLGKRERDDPGGLWVMRDEKDGQSIPVNTPS